MLGIRRRGRVDGRLAAARVVYRRAQILRRAGVCAEGAATVAENQGYARPDLLAEPDWLQAHAQDANLRLIDCATLEAYRRAHIPGAVGLPVHIYIKHPTDETFVMQPQQFKELME